jgi:hypothetical protein
MKKTFLKSLSVLLACLMLITQTQSLSARPSEIGLPSLDESVLVLDEEALELAMQDLNQLDEFLDVNSGVTFADLESAESELIAGFENSTTPLGMEHEGEPPLGIPSFLWGCILGVVGILFVYILTDGDKDETRKALWGMLVWVGVVVVGWVILGAAGIYAWY